MRLHDLVSDLSDVMVRGPAEVEITGLSFDSRTVTPGDLFVALPGAHVDGRDFIAAAVHRGAVAVLSESAPAPCVPQVLVPDARAALADVAATFYGHPSARLEVIGVTGTDGKTTTCYLLHTLLQATGRPAGLSSTVTVRIGADECPNPVGLTTPEAPVVQRLLAEMVAAGCRTAVLEVSSHALALNRLRGCRIDVGVFTNLSAEHLDFHGTLEEYCATKARLFRMLGQVPTEGAPPYAILNRDDPQYAAMRAASAAPVLSYGLHPDADVRACAVQVSAGGLCFRACTPLGDVLVRSPLIGRFHVSNLLAALTYAVARGIALDEAAAALATMPGVPGRMRRLAVGQPFTVMIDYAHTPAALAAVLATLREITTGRLIAVFGAPGERDRTKRPAMGRIAAAYCALVILTDDEPRGEESGAIIEEIATGARESGARDGETLIRCPDRRAAIRMAMRAARPGDAVLLAGKGHERRIIVGTEHRPWDEEAEARAALAAL